MTKRLTWTMPQLETHIRCLFLIALLAMNAVFAVIPLPPFSKLKEYYPGYKHHGGYFTNQRFIQYIGVPTEGLLHDTSALRLSHSINKIGDKHSLGSEMIHLSKYGHDSVTASNGLQYMYHPIAFGPYMADKYGYPNISRVHAMDPDITKKAFWGKQGILQVLTYTKKGNIPIGHIALWDCDHFHQTNDWISQHMLLTVEFWQTPDSNCTHMSSDGYQWVTTKPVELTEDQKERKRDKYFKNIYRTYFKHHHKDNDGNGDNNNGAQEKTNAHRSRLNLKTGIKNIRHHRHRDKNSPPSVIV